MRLKRPHPIRAIRARLDKRMMNKKAAIAAKPFTVVYDFDGTLADTIDEALIIFNDMARKRGYQPITTANMQQLRTMGVRQAASELGIPAMMLPILLLQGKRRLARVMSHVKPFEGVPAMLAEFHRKGIAQGVATSNSPKNIGLFFTANAFPVFEYIETGIGIFGKARRFKRMLRKYKLARERVIYVGDELRDIEAAREAGIRIISVTWGMNDRTALMSAHPDYVADTPAEVVRIVTELVATA